MKTSRLCDRLLQSTLSFSEKTPQEEEEDKHKEGELLSFFHQEASALMLQLKRQSRAQVLQLEEKQRRMEEKKEQVGKAQLQLENFLYKENYLRREIRDHSEFASTELKRVEEEMKVKIGMETFSEDLAVKHKESLMMLKKEMQKRKVMRNEYTQLLKEKEEKKILLEKKRKELSLFPEKVKQIRTLATSVFAEDSTTDDSNAKSNPSLPIGENNALQNVHHLTGPLYTLFYSLHAFSSSSTTESSSASIVENNQKWSVQLTIHLFDVHLEDKKSTDNSDEKTSSSAMMIIQFQHDPSTELVTASVSSLKLVNEKGSELKCNGNPKGFLLKHMYPNQPAGVDLGSGAYLWVQWICGRRTLPPPGSISSENETKDQEGLFYSLNTVLDTMKSRLRSLWRLSAIMDILGKHVGVPMSPTNPFPLPPILRHYYRLSMQLMASSMAPLKSSDFFSASSGVEVRLHSVQACAEPPADPFASSSLVGSTSEMEESQLESFFRSRLLRKDSDRDDCYYFKVHMKLVYSSSGERAKEDSEVVVALIEIPPQYPLRPPQVLLTSRKLSGKGHEQVDNMLKGIEQEVNAGCVSFLEVLTLAGEVRERLGEALAESSSVNQELSRVTSSGAVMGEAMDSLLLLQVSLLLQMLASAASATSSDRESGLTKDTLPTNHKGKLVDRRCLLSNFYGKRFSQQC